MLWRAVIVGAVLVALGALVLWLAVRFTLGRVVGATLVLAGLCRWRAMM